MATVGVVNVKFTSTTSEYSKGVAKAKQENKGFADNLKATLGEESAIGKQLKILQGAGAVAGLAIAANALNNITAKALELNKAWQAGDRSIGNIADGLLRSLPILGKMYEASRNLREIFTGEEAAEERALKLAEERLKVTQGYAKAMADAKAATVQAADAQQKFGIEMQMKRASPDEREFMQANIDLANELGAINKKWDDIKRAAAKDTATQLRLEALADEEFLDAMRRGRIRKGFIEQQQLADAMKQRRIDEQEMAKAAIDEAKQVADAVRTPGEVAAAEFERLQSLFNRGLITKDVFDKSKVEAYNRAFGNTVETAEQFADRMAQIRQSNQDTFTKYAKFAQGEEIPQPTVTERRGTFLTPSRTDPQSELKAAVTDGLNKVKDKVQDLITTITQNPAGLLMSIMGGKK